MRLPGPDDLTALRGRDSKYLSRWLRTGLFEFLFERKGRNAFPGADRFIEEQSDVSEDLAVVARALGERDRENLRAAGVIVLRELNFSDERESIVAELVLRLGAKIKALGMLEVLAEKSFRKFPGPKGTRLYTLAFEFARDLADLSQPYAWQCLRHLILMDEYFHPGLAGPALIALTEAAPNEFRASFDLLVDSLDAFYGYEPNSSGIVDKAPARKRLLSAILERLLDRDLILYPCRPKNRPEPETTNWWFNTLRTEFRPLFEDLQSAAPRIDELIAALTATTEESPSAHIGKPLEKPSGDDLDDFQLIRRAAILLVPNRNIDAGKLVDA